MSIEIIKSIRNRTGISFKDIKKVVEENPGKSEDDLIDILRKQGALKAKSREGRETSQGSIFSYVHEGRVGVMVEVKCETDFVARSDSFKLFGNDLCLHIAAYRPKFLNPESMDASFLEKELEIAKAQLLEEGKPANIIEKILEGKKSKVYEEYTLIHQKSLKDNSKSIEDLVAEISQTTGEKIEITRFTIYELN